MNPFKLLNTTAKVALLPREMGDISGHIRRKLNSILLVYSPELKAVPIMFSDVSFETGKEYGKIIEEMPWIHVNVKVQLLVFSVESGNVLQGKITQVRQL